MSELIDRLEIEVKKKGLTFNRIERELGLGMVQSNDGTIKARASTSSRRSLALWALRWITSFSESSKRRALRVENSISLA